jgi:hypothetical protein
MVLTDRPPRLLLMLQHQRRQMLQVLQHPDADGILASARARREWNDIGQRAPRYEAMRPSARQQRLPRGSAR